MHKKSQLKADETNLSHEISNTEFKLSKKCVYGGDLWLQ